jgi:DNA-binding winged helix-turn-helix (wHTH) protein
VKCVYFRIAALGDAWMSLQLDSAVGERLKFGEFELTPVARALWRRGEQVRLGSRALDILIALASRPGQILSKDDLTKLVWRGAFVDETALRVGISAVRKALGNDGDRYIATVPGRGYCFVHDVETTTAKPAPESADHAIAFGPFRLFATQHLLLEAEEPVRLGHRALEILITLVERCGDVVSKEELIARVWPNTSVEMGI